MPIRGYLGIDAGTQGLSVIFTDENLQVLGTGEGGYEMVAGLAEGDYEQDPADWIAALKSAMVELQAKLSDELDVVSIGISGQMHGEVLADENGECLGPARLWCDSRNEAEGDELTERPLALDRPQSVRESGPSSQDDHACGMAGVSIDG